MSKNQIHYYNHNDDDYYFQSGTEAGNVLDFMQQPADNYGNDVCCYVQLFPLLIFDDILIRLHNELIMIFSCLFN